MFHRTQIFGFPIIIFISLVLHQTNSSPYEILATPVSCQLTNSLPYPPDCELLTSEVPKTLMTRGSILTPRTGIPFGRAKIISLHKIITQCTVYFFGAEESSIEEDITIPCDERCIKSPETQLSDPVIYDCHWTGTRTKSQEIIKVLETDLFYNELGELLDGSSKWRSLLSGGYRDFQGRLLFLYHDVIQGCPFQYIKNSTFVVSKRVSLPMIITSEDSHLLLILRPSPVFDHCSVNGSQFFLSNHNNLVELHLTEEFRGELRYHDPPPRLSGDLQISELNWDLSNIKENLDHLIFERELSICHRKFPQWKAAQEKTSTEAISLYLTGDSTLPARIYPNQTIEYCYSHPHVILEVATLDYDINTGIAHFESNSGTNSIQTLTGYLTGIPGVRTKELLLRLTNGSLWNYNANRREESIKTNLSHHVQIQLLIKEDNPSTRVHLHPISTRLQKKYKLSNWVTDIIDQVVEWANHIYGVLLGVGILVILLLLRYLCKSNPCVKKLGIQTKV